MRRTRLIGHGLSVFPSPTARRDGEQIGYSPFRYCVQCGMPNDTRKTAWSESGDGFGPVTDVTVTAAPGQTRQVNTKDADVQSGCRFCGSLAWQYSKPEALPDDRNKPSEEWRRNSRNRRR